MTTMQRKQQIQQYQSERLFTASEVAEFEYCPLIWWYEQFEPLAHAETEDLFARMVELEVEHDTQAPALPEYQMIERLLVRRDAFEEGQPQEEAEEVEATEAEIEQELAPSFAAGRYVRMLVMVAGAVLLVAIVFIAIALFLRKQGNILLLSSILLPVGLGLLLLAVALFMLLLNEYRCQRSRLIDERHMALGLPPGELVYEDADGQGEPLDSTQFPLTGKPDYIVQLSDGRPVPIELKLNIHDATAPYSNHMLQIAAYCLILEDYFEIPPTHGIVRYADCEFTVEYTPAIRKKVIRMLGEMAHCSEMEPPALTRQKVNKCRACAFQPICAVGSSH